MLNKNYFTPPPKLVIPSSTALKGYLINTNGLATSVIARPNGDLSNLYRDKIATLANLAKNWDLDVIQITNSRPLSRHLQRVGRMVCNGISVQ